LVIILLNTHGYKYFSLSYINQLMPKVGLVGLFRQILTNYIYWIIWFLFSGLSNVIIYACNNYMLVLLIILILYFQFFFKWLAGFTYHGIMLDYIKWVFFGFAEKSGSHCYLVIWRGNKFVNILKLPDSYCVKTI